MIGKAAAVLVAGAAAATAVFGPVVLGGSNSASNASSFAAGVGCLATAATVTSGGRSVALTAVQLSHARTVIQVGKQTGVPPRGWLIAVATAMQESSLQVKANAVVPESLTLPHDAQGTDHDSVGLFQQRPSANWGSVQDLMDPAASARKFYQRLLSVDGWQAMTVTGAAQAVQHSGLPDAYAKWTDFAQQLVEKQGGVAVSAADDCTFSGSLDEKRTRILSAARAQLGKPYVFNAGDTRGSTKALSGCDEQAVGGCDADGFDCSGLTLFAYAQVGIRLDHFAATQYSQGRRVPLAQARPGDLLFWATNTGDPASIHHVAIYAGNDRMVEAAYSGTHLREVRVNHDSELMPMAVQPTR